MYNTQRAQERIKANPLAPIVQELKEPVALKEQIETFITFLKNRNYYSKLSLYIIKVYEYDSVRGDYCFSMSYIANSQEFYPEMFTHYIMIGDNAVVLNASNPNIKSVFLTLDIKSIEKEDVSHLISFLAPNDDVVVRYDPQGMIYCRKGENVIKTFYPFASDMPMAAQIHYYLYLPRKIPSLQIQRPQIHW